MKAKEERSQNKSGGQGTDTTWLGAFAPLRDHQFFSQKTIFADRTQLGKIAITCKPMRSTKQLRRFGAQNEPILTLTKSESSSSYSYSRSSFNQGLFKPIQRYPNPFKRFSVKNFSRQPLCPCALVIQNLRSSASADYGILSFIKPLRLCGKPRAGLPCMPARLKLSG